mgnify:FL=1
MKINLIKENFAVNDYEKRNKLLLASDAAVILDLFASYKENPRTPISMWEEKVNNITPEDISNKPNIIRGTVLEPVVREQLIPLFHPDIKVVEDKNTYYSPDNDFMACHIDGQVVGENRLAEIKCPAFGPMTNWKRDGKYYIPDYVKAQCLHILACRTGIEGIDVFAYAGMEVIHLPLDRNQEEVDLYVKVAKQFWKCVVDKTPPAPINNRDLGYIDARKERLDQYKEATPKDIIRLRDIEKKKKMIKILTAEIETDNFETKLDIGSCKGYKQNDEILCNLIRRKGKSGNTLSLTFPTSKVA